MKAGILPWSVSGMLLVVIALGVGGEAAKAPGGPSSADLLPGNKSAAAVTVPDPRTPSNAAVDAQATELLSTEVQAVIKMAGAGVPDAVIQSYVRSCNTVEPPTPNELIYLRNHQISAAVMLALIQRSKELEGQGTPAPTPAAYGAVYRYYSALPNPAGGIYSGYPPGSPYVANYPRPNVGLTKAYQPTAAIEQKKRADELAKQLQQTVQERNQAQAKLLAWNSTGLTPDRVWRVEARLQEAEREQKQSAEENAKLLGEKAQLQRELSVWQNPRKHSLMREGLKGKVVAVDPKWGFVVLNVGAEQGAIERGELLIHRDYKYIARVRLSSVETDRSIADIMPKYTQGDIKEGDEAFY